MNNDLPKPEDQEEAILAEIVEQPELENSEIIYRTEPETSIPRTLNSAPPLVTSTDSSTQQTNESAASHAVSDPKDTLPAEPIFNRLLNTLLHPSSLSWLMNVGGGLLFFGFVVWLWTIGLFENPVVAASILTSLNLVVLGVGAGIAKRWENSQSGKALTLLACLALPLNLWLYDAQGLIKLSEGGHLWIPALICTMIYTAIANILKDKSFVFTVVGGVTMTGLLFLADNTVGRIGETIAPSVLLTIIGTICLFGRYLFSKNPGPFSRDNFGLAMFQSGHVCLALGLGTLFSGRVYDRLGYQFFGTIAWEGVSFYWQIIPLFVLAVAIFNYLATYEATRKSYWLIPVEMLTIWAQWIALDVLQIQMTAWITSIFIATNAFLFYLPGWLTPAHLDRGQPFRWGQRFASILWWLAAAYLVTSTLFHDGLFSGQIEGIQVSCFLYVAGIGFVATWLNQNRRTMADWFQFYFSVVLVLVGVLMLGSLPFIAFEWTAFLMALIPVAVRKSPWRSVEKEVQIHLDNGLTLVAFSAWTTGFLIWFFYTTSLSPAYFSSIILAVSALMVGWVFAFETEDATSISLAGLSFNLVIWHLLSPLGLEAIHYVALSSVLGFVGLAVSRFSKISEKPTKVLDVSYHAVIFCSIATFMIAGSSLFSDTTNFTILAVAIAQSIALLICGFLSAPSRKANYGLLGTLNALCSAALLINLTDLSVFQILELGVMALGIPVLLYGHRLWHNEKSDEEDMTLSLMAGCLFLVVPLACGLIGIRFGITDATPLWRAFHEIGTLVIGLILVATGISFRLRVTTLAGSTTIVLYLVSLLTLFHLPEQLQNTSAYMMIGGGVFFGSAVLLSVFRERLLQIPKKIEKGDGVFQVLKWR